MHANQLCSNALEVSWCFCEVCPLQVVREADRVVTPLLFVLSERWNTVVQAIDYSDCTGWSHIIWKGMIHWTKNCTHVCKLTTGCEYTNLGLVEWAGPGRQEKGECNQWGRAVYTMVKWMVQTNIRTFIKCGGNIVFHWIILPLVP